MIKVFKVPALAWRREKERKMRTRRRHKIQKEERYKKERSYDSALIRGYIYRILLPFRLCDAISRYFF